MTRKEECTKAEGVLIVYFLLGLFFTIMMGIENLTYKERCEEIGYKVIESFQINNNKYIRCWKEGESYFEIGS